MSGVTLFQTTNQHGHSNEDGTDMFSDRRKGIFAFISNKEDETKKSYLSHCLDYI